MADFEQALKQCAEAVTRELDLLLSAQPLNGEIARPKRLIEAMRHGTFAGGKRLRPFLVIETARLFDADPLQALRAACAVECVHCYSLIHDDLPAMDDDDLRRGQPTVHRAFDEATAILAGDGLLTLAFDILADEATHGDPGVRLRLISGLARAAGAGGMAGGQMLDIQAEADRAEDVRQLHEMKTGALIAFSCQAGAIVGGADATALEAVTAFGRHVGAAFQLADDLLDVTASSVQMGKRTGKDAEQGKATLISLVGVEKVGAMAHERMAEAISSLAMFGESAATLERAARFIVERQR